jgi:hypothetical protein
MPAWLDRQREQRRRRDRERNTVIGAGAAGALGSEAYGRYRGRGTVTGALRNANTERGISSRNYRSSRSLSQRAATMTRPLSHHAEEAQSWREAQRTIASPPNPYRRLPGFSPKRFATAGNVGMSEGRKLTESQARVLGFHPEQFKQAKSTARTGVRQRNMQGIDFGAPLSRVRSSSPGTAEAKARARRENAAISQQQAGYRRALLRRYEAREAAKERAAAQKKQANATTKSRNMTQRAADYGRGQGAAAEQRMFSHLRSARRPATRMGLATAGAAGTAAAGIAGMKAWERRNATKANTLPAWNNLTDKQKKQAIGRGGTARPVSAIGTQGKKGVYQ